ncbi:hypothetical protein J2W22_000455 [Sphingomonas kyeonggiensis]|nr:hypothetical protein [Sphingomonas kyeonggiensis]
MRKLLAGGLALGILSASYALATETVTYSYDAKGRLVKVERSGTVNNSVKSEYAYDKANNRKNAKVTGSLNSAP